MSGCAGGGGGVVRDRETLEAVVGKAATQSLSSHLAARPVTVPRRHGSVWGWRRTHWCRERGGSTLRQQRRGGASVHRWWSARTGGQDGELEVTGSPPPLPCLHPLLIGCCLSRTGLRPPPHQPPTAIAISPPPPRLSPR